MSAMSVLIATPAYNNQVCASYVTSLVGFMAAAAREGIAVDYAHTISSSLIPIARNKLAHYFLQHTACTHLLFIDGDMTWRADDLIRMLRTDLDVVAAICPRKAMNWDSLRATLKADPTASDEMLRMALASYGTFQLLEPHATLALDEVVEVTAIGTGIMLIRRDVFERLRAASPQAAIRSGASAGEHVFFDTELTDDGVYLSEDITFCRRWRAIGGKVHAAPWFRVGHIGNYEHVGDLAVSGTPVQVG